MLIHRGLSVQRGLGIGSFFSGLFRNIVPLIKNVGRSIFSSPLVRTVAGKAVDAGKEALKNVTTDVLDGKKFSESAQSELNKAKKKISEAIKGRGKRKRLTNSSTGKKKKIGYYNLLDL